jgi:opacity protein-like surface antigen
MKKTLFAILIYLSVFLSFSNAQYVQEKHYLTPCLGFAWHGSTPEFGLNYEYAFGKELKNFAVGGIIRYLSYGESSLGGKWNYTYTYIGGQFNYHLELDNKKLDPFFGLTLGYNLYSASWEGSGYHFEAGDDSGLFLGAHATFRYWISPKIGISGRLNFGNSSYGGLDIGVDFKL